LFYFSFEIAGFMDTDIVLVAYGEMEKDSGKSGAAGGWE
jgi:hypothetical protein